MTPRPALATALAVALLAGLFGPAGCGAAVAQSGGVPPCCAERAVGTSPACCCASDDETPPGDAPASTQTFEERAQGGLLSGFVLARDEGAAVTALGFAPQIPVAGSAGSVHIVNCTFRC